MQKTNIQCLGFIMDGNRRWAKERRLETVEGHRKGSEVFAEVVEFIRDKSIPHAIFYSFSSENWQRDDEEVTYLLNLFAEKISELSEKLNKEEALDKKVRIRFVGDIGRFPDFLQKQIFQLEKETSEFTNSTIWIALSYGGRDEIVHAVNRAIEMGESVDEKTFERLLWTAGMPDPDLIIRTGGQQRLSNFLPWQSTYSELKFVDAYWPEVTSEMLDELLKEFAERQRNFGK